MDKANVDFERLPHLADLRQVTSASYLLYSTRKKSRKKSRWRVDVVLRTDAVSKVLRPSILMNFVLSTGEVRMVEARSLVLYGQPAAGAKLRMLAVSQVSVEQFHGLRHAVAEAIHEMESAQPKLALVNAIKR